MNVRDWAETSGRHYKKVSTREGGEYHGPCPKCGGNDRFHLWPEQKEGGTWWCRGCDKGGDLIEYLMVMEGMTFPEACKEVGRELPKQQDGCTPQLKRPAGENWQPRVALPPVEAWREHAGKFVAWAHERLLDLGESEGTPLDYLAKRGITRESAVRFRLGWNSGEKGKDQYRAREAWGLETVLKEGKKKKLWLPIGLVIPYFVGDELRRVRIRIPNERRTPDFSTPYYVVPGSSMEAFLIGPEQKAFFITEAELDGILIAQEGGDLTGVVAIGNSSARPTEDAYRSLTRSLHIAVALDYDAKTRADGKYENPGGKEWLWWKERFPQAERYPVPAGKDPGDAYKAGYSIREWVKLGLPPIFTIAGRQPTSPDQSDPSDRSDSSKGEAKMAFDPQKMQQLISDTYSRVFSECSNLADASQWLEKKHPDITAHLLAVGKEVDAAFAAEDEAAVQAALAKWERYHLRAWQRYHERPAVIDRESETQESLFEQAPTINRPE